MRLPNQPEFSVLPGFHRNRGTQTAMMEMRSSVIEGLRLSGQPSRPIAMKRKALPHTNQIAFCSVRRIGNWTGPRIRITGRPGFRFHVPGFVVFASNYPGPG